MKIERAKLDSKGRIVLPLTFRNALSLNENDFIYLALNERTNSVILSAQPEEKLWELQMEMSDEPGTLAKLAKVLMRHKVDLVSTESHSLERNQKATWRIACVFNGNWNELIKDLKVNGAENIQKKKT